MDIPKEPEIIVLTGRPKSGKSFCIKSMIYHWAKSGEMEFGLCICPTAFTGGYSYLPSRWVWDKYDEDRLEKYVERLRAKKKKLGDEMPANFVILDDCLGKIKWGSDFWSSWISTFRHTNTTIIISAQSLKGKGTSTLLRDCTSRALIYRTDFKNAIDGLYDAYGQRFPNEEAFKQGLQAATLEKHNCLVYVSGQDTFDETYCQFMAPEVPEFQLEY